MAAARKQAEKRRLDLGRVEVQGGDVPVQMVDRNERQLARPSERLGCRNAHEQRADEPRPLRHGDRVEILERRGGAGQRFADDRPDQLEVTARCDLGHDASVGGVQLGLRRDNRRPHLAVSRHEGSGRLVAGRLDPENHASSSPAGPFHMISASSRLSV